MWNNVDSNGAAYFEPSHLYLHCLAKSYILACGTEKIEGNYVCIYLSCFNEQLECEPFANEKTPLW